jgi:hypothetical protein
MASSMRNIIIVIIIAIAIGGIAFMKMGTLDREPSQPDTGETETLTTGGEETPSEEEGPSELESGTVELVEEGDPNAPIEEEEEEPEEDEETGWSPEPFWWTRQQVPMYSNIATVMVTGAPYPTPAHTQTYYLDVMEQTGVTVASWFDYMWKPVNNQDYQLYIDTMHERGVYVMGTESMITTFKLPEEPEEYIDAICLDPYGNRVASNYGLSGTIGEEQVWYVHSLLNPVWQEYLLTSIKQSIDYGVDGYLIDELCYGSVLEPDFSENTMTMFREYLADTLTTSEKNSLMNQYSYSSWDEFDYAEVVRRNLPAAMTSLSKEEWSDWSITQDMPLYNYYQRFVRLKNREAAQYIIEEAKQYSDQVNGYPIPFTANVNDLTSPESYLVMDLIDFVDLECTYNKFTQYFPRTRMISSIKLANSLGTRPYVLTTLETRSQISEKGAEGCRNFYKLAIAETSANGGNFYMEEAEHGVAMDIEMLAPYYQMTASYPELFEIESAKNQICVLSLWENQESYQNKAFSGTCNILTDTGYQYDVVFGAEDYSVWGDPHMYPAPNYQLILDQIRDYELVIIPELSDITDNHAELLIEYMESGGTVLVFTNPIHLSDIDNQRGADSHVNQLLGYLDHEESTVGSGTLFTINQVKGMLYIDLPDSPTRNDFINMISSTGIAPEITGMTDNAVGKTMYSDKDEAVIHVINYQYDWMQDKVKTPNSYTLEITLPESLTDQTLTITYITPETIETQLTYIETGAGIEVTVPSLDVWGIIHITAG